VKKVLNAAANQRDKSFVQGKRKPVLFGFDRFSCTYMAPLQLLACIAATAAKKCIQYKTKCSVKVAKLYLNYLCTAHKLTAAILM